MPSFFLNLNVPGADEAGVHVVAVGERVAGEQLQVPQVRRVRRPPETRVVGAVLCRDWGFLFRLSQLTSLGWNNTCKVVKNKSLVSITQL